MEIGQTEVTETQEAPPAIPAPAEAPAVSGRRSKRGVPNEGDIIPSDLRDLRVENWLADQGADFRLIWLSLAQVNRAESLRNQARIVSLDSETVERYEAAVRNGAQFPPLVVFQKGDLYVIIDGNHRVAAFDLNTLTDVPAYLVVEPSKIQVAILTYQANTTNGRPPTYAERIGHAITLIAQGIPQPEVAALLSLNPGALQHAVYKQRADERFGTLEVRRIERLTPSARIRLAQIRSNVVLKAAATLAVEAGLRGGEVDALVLSVNKVKSSEKDQLALIDAERLGRAGTIKATAHGRVQIPRHVTTYMRATSMLVRLGQQGLRESLAQVPPEMRGDLVRASAGAVDVLMAASRDLRTHRDE